ncbi:MAG: SH3 domain-containing protein [Candidatus Sulfopaludibacter sp.]|nr:SH3 domain-containing protein [Candidatus Sulfopaludibacter sp.]
MRQSHQEHSGHGGVEQHKQYAHGCGLPGGSHLLSSYRPWVLARLVKWLIVLRFGFISKVSFPATLILLLAACQTGPPRDPSIGEAYVGPATLNLRSDIPMESKKVATVRHGDRLEILQRRRKFFRVRAPSGAEGWANENTLLAAADMTALKDLAARAAKMPSQGAATVYGDLPVHTTTSTSAPSFLVIKPSEKVEVLSQLRVPRTDVRRTALLPPAPKKAKALPKKKESKGKYPLPPMPKPPPPPPDWLELSKTDLSKEVPEPEPESGPKIVPSDLWSLVRTASGQSGWVLTRRLTMAIPDEVAQYAEGHRIVSYFSLATVQVDGETKSTWLWTTIGGGGQPYDFDSFRVFVWSLRHRRYETAYVQHTVEGYQPVLVKEVEYGGKGVASGKYPGFSVCVVNRDGAKVRQEFALIGNIVRFAGETPCETAVPLRSQSASSPLPGAAQPAVPPEKPNWWQRLKARVRGLTKH